MRYITNEQIEPGVVLALPIYGSNFEILLGKGMELSASHIQRIIALGYSGVYINDKLSEDITPVDIVPIDVRLDTIKAAKEILQQAEKGEIIKVSRERQSKIILSIIDAVIDSPTRMVDMIDLKPFDDYLYYHTANVVILSLLVGVELGISGSSLYDLGMAALLHDVGNIFIPDSILNKPGNLSPEEFDIIKSHSQMGFDYLRENFGVSIEACMGALQHHENYDGTGYPNSLKKNKISIYGRIIAITDVFGALTSRRPFRQPVFPHAAMDFMDAKAGTMFDPDILNALKQVVALYPAGCCVELDSGARCITVENYHGDTSRPKVKLIGDTAFPIFLDLHADPSLADIHVSEILY